jgi:hypothetical protein
MIMNKRVWKSAAIVCAIGLLIVIPATGQSEKSDSAASAKTTAVAKQLKPQTTCPVMGGEIDKSLFYDYKEKRIYVCCEGCVAKLKKNPEKYIKKLEKMGQAPIDIPQEKSN